MSTENDGDLSSDGTLSARPVRLFQPLADAALDEFFRSLGFRAEIAAKVLRLREEEAQLRRSVQRQLTTRRSVLQELAETLLDETDWNGGRRPTMNQAERKARTLPEIADLDQRRAPHTDQVHAVQAQISYFQALLRMAGRRVSPPQDVQTS